MHVSCGRGPAPYSSPIRFMLELIDTGDDATLDSQLSAGPGPGPDS